MVELVSLCIDPSQLEADRLAAAIRIEELQMLLEAPSNTREETERKREEWRARQRKARAGKDGGAANVRHLKG